MMTMVVVVLMMMMMILMMMTMIITTIMITHIITTTTTTTTTILPPKSPARVCPTCPSPLPPPPPQFTSRAWPHNLHGMVCSDDFAPEIWFDKHTAGDGRDVFYCTAFFTSDQARAITGVCVSVSVSVSVSVFVCVCARSNEDYLLFC